MYTFKHVDAKTVAEASSALAEGNAVAVAGGTDLLGTLKDRNMRDYPETVVNLKSITPSLDYIKEEGSMLKIGALTRLHDIATNTTVLGNYAALAQAASRTASPHIRELGTIGGNMCQGQVLVLPTSRKPPFDCLRKGAIVATPWRAKTSFTPFSER
jgi:CO/xanthine dehydrogenase FAD-binding subunit